MCKVAYHSPACPLEAEREQLRDADHGWRPWDVKEMGHLLFIHHTVSDYQSTGLYSMFRALEHPCEVRILHRVRQGNYPPQLHLGSQVSHEGRFSNLA